MLRTKYFVQSRLTNLRYTNYWWMRACSGTTTTTSYLRAASQLGFLVWCHSKTLQRTRIGASRASSQRRWFKVVVLCSRSDMSFCRCGIISTALPLLTSWRPCPRYPCPRYPWQFLLFVYLNPLSKNVLNSWKNELRFQSYISFHNVVFAIGKRDWVYMVWWSAVKVSEQFDDKPFRVLMGQTLYFARRPSL